MVNVLDEPSIDEAARRRFEAAWHAGTPDPIERHAPSGEDPLHAATVEELIHIELELGWRAHLAKDTAAPPPVEDFLTRFARLRTPGIARRLLEQEFRIRARLGSPPPAGELGARFTALFPDLPHPTIGPPPDPMLDEPLPGMTLGRYRLRDEHARGGMGRVWRAHDLSLDRTIAIKQLAPGLVKRDELRRRFFAEARIAARLDHPGVVPVYELVDGDPPYYVMKLVRGETLTQLIARAHDPSETDRSLARGRVIETVLAVARTVAFAHSRGVLHRDLKPDNVIVGEFGETVLLDWGLARALDEPADEEAGTILGTPGYMAPEQARGDIELVDARSDVFALGAILHHALAGTPPRAGVPLVAPEAPPELCSITARALAAAPADRYQDAAELVAQLAQFQAGQLVGAHRYSAGELVRRWIRRHRAVVATALVLLLAVAAMAAVAIRQTVVGRDRARANLQRATATMIEQGRGELLAGDHDRAARVLGEAYTLGADTPILRYLLASAMRAIDAPRPVLASGVRALESLDNGRLATLDADGVVRIRDGATGAIVRELAADHPRALLAAGDTVVTLGIEAEIWDPVSGRRRAALGSTSMASLAQDGRSVAIAGATVTVRDAANGTVLRELPDSANANAVALSGDGKVIAAGWLGGELRAWSLAGEELGRWKLGAAIGGVAIDSIAISASGTTIVASSRASGVLGVARPSTAVPLQEYAAVADRIELDPSGTRLLISGGAHAGAVVDLATLRPIITAGELARLLPDGLTAVTASRDGELTAWDVVTGARLLRMRARSPIASIARTSGMAIAVIRRDAVVERWNLTAARPALHAAPRWTRHLVFNAAGLVIAFSEQDHAAIVQPPGANAISVAGEPLAYAGVAADGTVLAIRGGPTIVAVSHDRRRYLAITDRVRMFDATSHAQLAELAIAPPVAAALSPDGSIAALATGNGTVDLRRTADDTSVATIATTGDPTTQLAFSPDGALLAVTGAGQVHVFDGHTGAVVTTLRDIATPWVARIAFDPTGTRLATGDGDGGVIVWDARSGARRNALAGHTQQIQAIAFDDRGDRILTASVDRTARLWDAATGSPLEVLDHGAAVTAAVFSPDGDQIATATEGTELRIWVRPAERRTPAQIEAALAR